MSEKPVSYVVQYNNGRYSCGPILLLNALRHQGYKATRRHLPWIARLLKAKSHGVYVRDLESVGRRIGVFRRMYKPTIPKWHDELVKGHGIAFRMGMTKTMEDGTVRDFGHYVLISAMWCHRGKISYYFCNVGHQCKWWSLDEFYDHYMKKFDQFRITHVWVVPVKPRARVKLVA